MKMWCSSVRTFTWPKEMIFATCQNVSLRMLFYLLSMFKLYQYSHWTSRRFSGCFILWNISNRCNYEKKKGGGGAAATKAALHSCPFSLWDLLSVIQTKLSGCLCLHRDLVFSQDMLSDLFCFIIDILLAIYVCHIAW